MDVLGFDCFNDVGRKRWFKPRGLEIKHKLRWNLVSMLPAAYVPPVSLTLHIAQKAQIGDIPSRRVSTYRAARCLILKCWASMALKMNEKFGWTAKSFKMKN